MKKVILSMALVAGVSFTTLQASNVLNSSMVSISQTQDDGFVDIKFEELNEKVQAAVRTVNETYELNSLKYNAETQQTKVEATKRDDRSQKVFIFDNEGKEVVQEQAPAESTTETTVEETVTEETTEQPSAELSRSMQDDGFVTVKLEELNENVQAAVKALSETFEVAALQHNAEKGLTKVDLVNKEDQSTKTVYLNNEGAETTLEQPAETETETQTEEVI